VQTTAAKRSGTADHLLEVATEEPDVRFQGAFKALADALSEVERVRRTLLVSVW
jgi:hypothetical protein